MIRNETGMMEIENTKYYTANVKKKKSIYIYIYYKYTYS